MRASTFVLSLFASCAALVAAADVDNVIASLNTLSSDLKVLDNDVKQVQSGIYGISQALQVGVDTVQVDNDIIATSGVVNGVQAKFGVDDSNRIISVLNDLTSLSNTTLTDTIAKASAFGGLAPVVLASLYQLKGDTNNLGFALAFKLDQSVINQGVTDLVALQNGYAQAITAYGGTN